MSPPLLKRAKEKYYCYTCVIKFRERVESTYYVNLSYMWDDLFNKLLNFEYYMAVEGLYSFGYY